MRGLLMLGDKTEAKALVDAVRHARFDADFEAARGRGWE